MDKRFSIEVKFVKDIFGEQGVTPKDFLSKKYSEGFFVSDRRETLCGYKLSRYVSIRYTVTGSLTNTESGIIKVSFADRSDKSSIFDISEAIFDTNNRAGEFKLQEREGVQLFVPNGEFCLFMVQAESPPLGDPLTRVDFALVLFEKLDANGIPDTPFVSAPNSIVLSNPRPIYFSLGGR